MKELIVFGATGGTGRQVVHQALIDGFEVTVVVRNKKNYTLEHPHLKVIEGDVLKPATFSEAMNWKDAVVSCLGSRDRKQTTVYSEGVTNIMQAMKNAGVRRIICLSAGAVEIPPDASFIMKWIIKHILQRLFKYSYADMLLMEKILYNSNFYWTVIRPPRLLTGEKEATYRTSINEFLPKMTTITRADLAHYILHHLEDEKTYKSRVEISY